MIQSIRQDAVCECGHSFKHHSTNSPNPGYGCDHPIPTPEKFVGGIFDNGNERCSCMFFREKKSGKQ